MKTLFVALVAILFAFFLGCQSSITDPEVLEPTKFVGASEQENSAYKDALSYYPGTIKLDGMLYDPSHHFNSFAEINGIVRYRLEQTNTAKRPPRSAIKVQLYINAELIGGHTGKKLPWTVNGTSEDIIYTSPTNQAVYCLEKAFRVKNTCCNTLNLVLKFKVAEKLLTLESMHLMTANTRILPIGDSIN